MENRITTVETLMKEYRADTLRHRDEIKSMMLEFKQEFRTLNENMKEHILFKKDLEEMQKDLGSLDDKVNKHNKDDKQFHVEANKQLGTLMFWYKVIAIIIAPITIYVFNQLVQYGISKL